MLILSERDVAALIEPSEAIDLACAAYREHSRTGAGLSARAALWRDSPKAGCLIIAGAADASGDGPDLLAIKSNVHTYPDGPDAPRQWGGLLTLWNLADCRPCALIASGGFNERRTAAGFAAAARRFAPQDPRALAVFGAGKSAYQTILYLTIALPTLAGVILVGRSTARIAALAERLRETFGGHGPRVRTDAAPGEAAAQADVIVTVTTSPTPVFPGAAAKPGALVILGGANRADAREADDALMRRAVVLVDSRANARDKAGDIVLALASGALGEADIAGEIGEFLEVPTPSRPGRDVIVAKSTGLATQDLLLARRLFTIATATGRGRRVDLDDGGAP